MILITGENSFIGKHIISNLKNHAFDEISLINNRPTEIDFSKYSCVIHLAAIVHQKKSIPRDLYFQINSDLAYETAVAAKKNGIKHFIFFSTIKVYGNGGYESVRYDELSECKPVDDYGKSKLEAEKRILGLASENFLVSIIRPSVVYGKGVKANIQSLVKLVKVLPVVPFGGIKNVRSMVSIHNLMETLNAVINKPTTDIFLACDKKYYSTSELVFLIALSINRNKRIIAMPKIIQLFLRKLFPSIMVRLIGSFHVDASITHHKLGIVDKLIDSETAFKEMLSE